VTGVQTCALPISTRDAAFGGSGEKVLAEGQFAFLEDTNSTQFYDGAAWQGLGGKIGQVLSTFKADAFSTSSATFVDVTGLSVSITPSSATSKILVMAMISSAASTTNDTYINLNRDATAICQTTSGVTISTHYVFSPSASQTQHYPVTFLDSPATTAATTYKIQARVGSDTFYLNRRGPDTTGSTSTITVMEVLP
jgi:hypothetical protein